MWPSKNCLKYQISTVVTVNHSFSSLSLSSLFLCCLKPNTKHFANCKIVTLQVNGHEGGYSILKFSIHDEHTHTHSHTHPCMHTHERIHTNTYTYTDNHKQTGTNLPQQHLPRKTTHPNPVPMIKKTSQHWQSVKFLYHMMKLINTNCIKIILKQWKIIDGSF